MGSTKIKIGRYLPLVCFLALLPGHSAWAADQAGERNPCNTLTLDWENDLLFGTDGEYSNGVRLTWSTTYRPDQNDQGLSKWEPGWLNKIPGGNHGAGRAVSLAIGQAIYTPANIKKSEPDSTDRPYAGYSYLAAALHYRNPAVKTTWEVQAGVVGPQAYAEQAQNFFHDWAGTNRAQGWDYQLNNEPTLELIGERQWLLLRQEAAQGFGFDLIPHFGGQFGSVAILANLGGEMRWGWRLPNRFGVCTIRGGCENDSGRNDENPPPGMALRSWYLFAGGDGRWVLRNIFLDGNNFTDSPSVERMPLVGEVLAGVTVQYWITQLTCAAVYRTKEFETQGRSKSFGSFSLSLIY